jgi:hypothetical protein
VTDPLVSGCDSPLSPRHDVALLDLDGVLYVGPDAGWTWRPPTRTTWSG